MHNRQRLFWGLFFITLGALFLARNWGLFTMPDWHFVRGLWPVLLILGGIALMLRQRDAGQRDAGRSNSAASVAATAALAVALPFWLFSFFSWGHHWRGHHDRDRDDYGFRIDPPDPPDAPDAPDAPTIDGDDADDDDRDEHKTVSSFVEDMPTPAPAEARFVLEGGAAAFKMREATSRLIDARSEAITPYTMSIDRNANGSAPTIRLQPVKNGRGQGINIDLSDDHNVDFGEVAVKLNEAPVWDMEMDFGAGAADFDLRRYNVRNLDIEAGAASLELRLGDKAPQSEVKISSGMASVKIRVPKSVGVKIVADGGLNATDIDDDFDRVGNQTYLSPNYNASTKKITIRYDGGMSHFEVERE